MTATVPVYDAVRVNIAQLPPGYAAGYSTGTGIVPWTAADWAAHPGAVRIDQDPAASDPTADILDVEAGAATFADCPGWYKRALADYRSAARPGQRAPAIYASLSNLPAVANALISGGVTSRRVAGRGVRRAAPGARASRVGVPGARRGGRGAVPGRVAELARGRSPGRAPGAGQLHRGRLRGREAGAAGDRRRAGRDRRRAGRGLVRGARVGQRRPGRTAARERPLHGMS